MIWRSCNLIHHIWRLSKFHNLLWQINFVKISDIYSILCWISALMWWVSKKLYCLQCRQFEGVINRVYFMLSLMTKMTKFYLNLLIASKTEKVENWAKLRFSVKIQSISKICWKLWWVLSCVKLLNFFF